MCEKAREVKDPLSHNPEVYYRQAQYFHSKLDCTNTLLYLSLALDASSKEDAPNIGSLIMAKQAQSLARVTALSPARIFLSHFFLSSWEIFICRAGQQRWC